MKANNNNNNNDLRATIRPRSGFLHRLFSDETGATAVEYIVLVVVLGVGMIGAWYTFGGQVNEKLQQTGSEINAIQGPLPQP